MLTDKDIEDMVKVTMKDFPKPKVADLLLCGVCKEDDAIMVDFITRNYTNAEIKEGLNEHIKRIEFMLKLFKG